MRFIACPILMYFFKELIFSLIDIPFMHSSVKTMLNSWYNFSFMLCLVSAFLLLYWTNNGVVQRILAPYGRMSLTDYVTQSVIGSFLYFGYGMELHKTCGTTYSLLIGLMFLAVQIAFAHCWFKYFKRGPLETIWHRLTWIKIGR